MLDLYAEEQPFYEKTDSFYGQPYIWCFLGNFGGDTGWYGDLSSGRSSFESAINLVNSTIVGSAIVPEGLFQNEFVYDYILKMGCVFLNGFVQVLKLVQI